MGDHIFLAIQYDRISQVKSMNDAVFVKNNIMNRWGLVFFYHPNQYVVDLFNNSLETMMTLIYSPKKLQARDGGFLSRDTNPTGIFNSEYIGNP